TLVLGSYRVKVLILFFFFSSRRRHTRWPRDWSSDVCSSDLTVGVLALHFHGGALDAGHFARTRIDHLAGEAARRPPAQVHAQQRSEERRVGKECRSRGSP